jgi:hypothetical protein
MTKKYLNTGLSAQKVKNSGVLPNGVTSNQIGWNIHILLKIKGNILAAPKGSC